MTILVLSSSYPSRADDHRARFVHEMARSLREAVVVLTPAPAEPSARTETIDGVSIRRFAYPLGRLGLAGGGGILPNLRASPTRLAAAPGLVLAMALELRRTIAAVAPDRVLAHWLVPAGLAVALARPKAPAVVLAHGSDVHLLGALPLGGRLVERIRARATIAAASVTLGAKMAELGLGAPDHVIPMGIDAVAAAPPTPGPGLRLCTMSRLIEGKGVEAAIDAVRADPSVTLSIAGDGPLEPELRRRAGGLDRVRFVGPVAGAQKRAFLRGHDVFLFLGRSGRFPDNLPVAVLEAMAEGLVVVATRVGALEELVGSAGLLVESAEAASRAIASVRAMSPAERLRLGEAAISAASARTWRDSLAALDRAFSGPAARGA